MKIFRPHGEEGESLPIPLMADSKDCPDVAIAMIYVADYRHHSAHKGHYSDYVKSAITEQSVQHVGAQAQYFCRTHFRDTVEKLYEPRELIVMRSVKGVDHIMKEVLLRKIDDLLYSFYMAAQFGEPQNSNNCYLHQ